MKFKGILVAAAAILISSASFAQEQGDIRASGALAFGTKAAADSDGEGTGGIGINLGAEYVFTDGISIAPSYSFFFEKNNLKTSTINIDARYYFATDGTQVYGLLGFASTKASVSVGGLTVSSTDSGLNVGAGAIFPLSDAIGIGLQGKYQTAGEGQIVLQGGLTFMF